jgi:hypothetical protein
MQQQITCLRVFCTFQECVGAIMPAVTVERARIQLRTVREEKEDIIITVAVCVMPTFRTCKPLTNNTTRKGNASRTNLSP